MLTSKQQYPTVVSLFSGCGGFDYGFSKAGFSILTAYDYDPHAITCYNLNHGSPAVLKQIDEAFQLNLSPDVIIAGPPCQGFSTGGGYKDEDPRNVLLLTTCRIIAANQPKLAVIENVAALTNSKNCSHFENALGILASAGYYCHYETLLASDYGVAQRRRRTIIIARRGKQTFVGSPPKIGGVNTIRNAFIGLTKETANHTPVHLKVGSQHDLIARQILPGQKLCNVRAGSASIPTWEIPEYFGSTTESEKTILHTVRTLRRRNRKRNFGDADPVTFSELQTACPFVTEQAIHSLVERGFLRTIGNAIDLKHTFNGKYRRLSLSDTSPTVDTRFGDVQLFLHPTENRSLTVREAARIQGFPDEFIFPAIDKVSYRLIGNAVPPPMAESIAAFCKELL